tara:strand:- start:555 stop:971 length:417 start_codon:yes stop_codon:yes gene_type:complete
VRIAKFGPGSVATTYAYRGKAGRSAQSTNAFCQMYQDRDNYVTFRLLTNGRAAGAVGNLWQVLLYKVSSGRFSFRLIDPKGAILVTLTRTGGVANLMAAVNSNATVSRIVNMRITGTIADGTVFAGSITDYCRFNGGS